MQTEYIFVYGSLLSGFKNPAYEYISRYFEWVEATTVPGTLYDLGSYPAATPDNTGHTIVGELYRIKNPNELSYAIAQLDGYEGIQAEDGDMPQYKREMVAIENNGVVVNAWIYWYNGDVRDKPIIASGDVREYIKSKNT